jgi:secernin
MCDTTVAMGNATLNGEILFGKNSDRDPNEAHLLDYFTAGDHLLPARLKCTYIEIPQVARTHAVLLSKPFWIWGAEMGANDQGVVIGNEALFTKVPHEKTPGLIGMDLLRLGLERGSTALQALKVITGLLSEYGQSGNCAFAHPFQYHNSFLIVDPHEAWVLETAGREWAAEKVQSVRSISNAITIGNNFDLASDHLVQVAVEKGWCKSERDFDFSRCYSDFIYTTFSDARHRNVCTSDILHKSAGQITLPGMMEMIQTHTTDDPAAWSPDRALAGADVCMHFGFGPIRINQTTGSMVSSITPGQQVHWLTGTAAPCLSTFKPVWMDAGLPDQGVRPTGEFTAGSLWWEHEQLHRAALRDYPGRRSAFIGERNVLQSEFIEKASTITNLPLEERLAYSKECFIRSREKTTAWYQAIRQLPVQHQPSVFYLSAWKKIDREAKYIAS